MSQLDHILTAVRGTLAEHKQQTSPAELERKAAEHSPRGFARQLRSQAAKGPAIIAEIKKASPSRGVIREDFEPSQLARGFAAAGAAALSVLTEEQFFRGSLDYLELASHLSGLPCLRKDFICDPFQILEARAYGADAILLIAAMLQDQELETLASAAHGRGLDVLVEVHSAEELLRVLGLDLAPDMIGVNNRDLRTFEVSLDRSIALAPLLPKNAVRIAESGIHSAEDITRLRGAGYDAFLIGESLMRQPDPGAALSNLIAAAEPAGVAVKS